MEKMMILSQVCSCVTAVAAAVVLLVRPVRDWITGANRLREGQKCLLRSSMLRTYYRNREQRTIRQYESENFLLEYRAYQALKGNSFIDKIREEVGRWTVIS